MCCFLYLFYIKPQRSARVPVADKVVSCICSTSNHNSTPARLLRSALFPVSVLHQTTTRQATGPRESVLFPVSVLHQTTTYACISSDYQRYISEISLQKQRKWLEIICQRSKKVPIALDRPAILSEPCLGSSGYSRTVCR